MAKHGEIKHKKSLCLNTANNPNIVTFRTCSAMLAVKNAKNDKYSKYQIMTNQKETCMICQFYHVFIVFAYFSMFFDLLCDVPNSHHENKFNVTQ